jgi:hypothetical protein
MCPGVPYDISFKWLTTRVEKDETRVDKDGARPPTPCTLTLSVAGEQVYKESKYPNDWLYQRVSVPKIQAGQSGTRRTSGSSDLLVTFRGEMTCPINYTFWRSAWWRTMVPFWHQNWLDELTLVPVPRRNWPKKDGNVAGT